MDVEFLSVVSAVGIACGAMAAMASYFLYRGQWLIGLGFAVVMSLIVLLQQLGTGDTQLGLAAEATIWLLGAAWLVVMPFGELGARDEA